MLGTVVIGNWGRWDVLSIGAVVCLSIAFGMEVFRK